MKFSLFADQIIILIKPEGTSEGNEREYQEDLDFEQQKKVANTSAARSSIKKPRKSNVQHLSSTTYNVPFQLVGSGRRNPVLYCDGHKYIQNNKYSDKIYWKCSKWHDACKARAITLINQPKCIIRRNEHNHPDTPLVKEEARDDDNVM